MDGLAERNNYLSFDSFQMINNQIILSNLRGNGLFIMNPGDFHIDRIEKFIQMPDEAQRYHRGSCEWENNVFFYPNAGNGIHKYNTLTHEQTYIETGWYPCGAAFIHKGKMILLPWYKADKILTMDLKTNQLCKLDWWRLDKYEIGTNFLNTGRICENRIWMSAARTPYLFITDLSERTVDAFLIGDEDNQIWGSAYDGKSYWFTLLKDERIVKWNMDDRVPRYFYAGKKCNFEKNKIVFKKIIVYEEQVFVVPADRSGIYLLDTVHDQLECLTSLPGNMKTASSDWSMEYQIQGGKIVMCFGLTNLVAVMDPDSHAIDFYDTTVKNDPQFEAYVRNLCDKKIEAIENKPLITEGENSDLANLSDFIELIKSDKSVESNRFKASRMGESIYKYVQA